MKFDFTLQQLVAYYRACYELDNKQLELFDYFSKQNSNRLIVASSKLITTPDYFQKVNLKWGGEVAQKLRIYEKELDLYASSYFFITKVSVFGRAKLSSVPLFLTPVQLEFDLPDYLVSKTEKATLINPQAARAIQKLHLNYELDEVFKLLEKAWKLVDFKKRLSFLKEKFNAIDFSLLDESSRFLTQYKLKEVLKSKKVNIVLPALGLGLINKPSASRGVLSELQAIALENKFYPALIESVFLGTNNNISSEEKEIIHVPANLSIPQQKIIKSAYQNNLTLAVGPPGTGKSYTIASIAVDAIANGKSVLISSKNDQALKVIADKLEKDFNCKENIISSGDKYFNRKILNKLKGILTGIDDDYVYNSLKVTINNQLKSIQKIEASILELENDIRKKSNNEIDLTELLLSEKTFTNRIKLFFSGKKISNSEELKNDLYSLKNKIEIRKEWVSHLIECNSNLRVAEVLREKGTYDVFSKMIQVIESDSGLEKEGLFYSLDFNKILKRFLYGWSI